MPARSNHVGDIDALLEARVLVKKAHRQLFNYSLGPFWKYRAEGKDLEGNKFILEWRSDDAHTERGDPGEQGVCVGAEFLVSGLVQAHLGGNTTPRTTKLVRCTLKRIE